MQHFVLMYHVTIVVEQSPTASLSLKVYRQYIDFYLNGRIQVCSCLKAGIYKC